MKIKRIKTILTSPGRNYLIVAIKTDNGIIGYGDATLNGRELVVKSLIDNYLADWLQGKNADKIEDIWQMVYKGGYWQSGPILMTALSGIDMALWDIKGKKYNAPLYSVFGGKSREKLRIYKHIHGRNNQELLDNIKKIDSEFLRFSFDTCNPYNKSEIFQQPHQNIKKGRIEVDSLENPGKWDSDIYLDDLINKIKFIREKTNNNIKLIHDVHGRLTTSQAMRAAKKLEKFNLFFLEDPVNHQNKKALELIKANSCIPIAIGELFTTMDDCRELISKQIIDYIRVDISHFGGITQVLKLAAFADIYGIKLALHGPSDISPLAHSAMAHINLSVPNFGIQEFVDFNDEVSTVFDSPIKFNENYLELDDRKGLGVKINEKAAKKYDYNKKYLPILRDRMGAIHKW